MIAATDRDLKGAVDRGEFRADLLDRLGEVILAMHACAIGPGNVQELEQALNRAVLGAAGRWIVVEDLGLPGAAMPAALPPSLEAILLTSR